MRSDIDALMQERELDAIMVIGPAQHNPPMYYLTGGGHLTRAVLIKKNGDKPVLFHTSMERDEAAATGLPVMNMDQYRFNDLLKQVDGDVLKASVKRFQHMFSDAGLEEGRVAVYGKIDAGESYALLSALQEAMPGLSFMGETGDSEFTTEVYDTSVWPVLFGIAVVVFAPAFEETFFRGFLFAGLRQSPIGTAGAVALTAAMWTLLHIQYEASGMSIIFFLGIVLGIVRYKTGSLWTVILIHALWNLFAVLGAAAAQ